MKHHYTRNIGKKVLVFAFAGILLASVIAAISSITGRVNPFAPDAASIHRSNEALLKMHIHTQLGISLEGRDIGIPANIGIESTLHRNHTLDVYGTMNPAVSPLHTHDPDGIIHVESTEIRAFTLGEFLDVWGLDFSDRNAILVVNNGQAIEIDYRNHVLRDGEQILLSVQ